MLAKLLGLSGSAAVVDNKKGNVVCDSVPGLPFTFEADRYMGNWYEIYHSKGEGFQPDSWTCSQASYTDLDTEAGTFKVYNSGEGRFYGPRFGVHGDAMCPSDTSEFGEGQCFVKFFTQPFYDTPNYQIIDTDYESYSIIYACHEDDMQYLWLMSRTPELSDELYESMMDKARTALPNYDFDQLIKDDQALEKCKYITDN